MGGWNFKRCRTCIGLSKGECDAIIAKRARNLGKHQIRKEKIPNLEVTRMILNLGDLELDGL